MLRSPCSAAPLVAIVAVVALAAPAFAADSAGASDKEKARAHFERGQRLFKVSRYKEALEEFKEAFVLRADPVFLYNIAQCHRLMGERDEAITFYRRYLQADPNSPQRVELEKRIHDLEAARAEDQTARLAQPPPPPPVAVAKKPKPAPAPTPPPIAVVPPPAPTAAPPLAVVASAPAPQPESKPLYRRWWLWAGVAAVAAGVAAAVVLSKSDATGCGPGVVSCERL